MDKVFVEDVLRTPTFTTTPISSCSARLKQRACLLALTLLCALFCALPLVPDLVPEVARNFTSGLAPQTAFAAEDPEGLKAVDETTAVSSGAASASASASASRAASTNVVSAGVVSTSVASTADTTDGVDENTAYAARSVAAAESLLASVATTQSATAQSGTAGTAAAGTTAQSGTAGTAAAGTTAQSASVQTAATAATTTTTAATAAAATAQSASDDLKEKYTNGAYASTPAELQAEALARQKFTDEQAAAVTDAALAGNTSVTLFRVDEAGKLTQVSGFEVAPAANQLSNFLVRVTRSTSSDLLLPVVGIGATSGHDDTFTVTVSLEGTQAFLSVASRQLTFTVPKIRRGTVTINVDNQPVAAYVNFEELIAAMTADNTGTYYIGADLTASGSTGSTYMGEFAGKLIGNPAKTPTIFNLTKPLFSNLKGATIQNINFANVNMTSGSGGHFGTLAMTTSNNGSTRTTIEDVHVWGTINSNSNGASVGGIVGSTQSLTVNRVSFIGDINTGTNVQNTGGLFGSVNAQSDILYSYVDVNITAASTRGNHPVGGLVGWLVGTAVQHNYVTGTLKHTGSDSPNVGGIFGGNQNGGRATTTIVSIEVSGTNAKLIHGNNGAGPGAWDVNHGMKIYVVEGTTQELSDNDKDGKNYGQTIVSLSKADLAAKLAEEKITLVAKPEMPYSSNEFADISDLTKQAGYRAENRIAYGNVAKLMPLAAAKELVQAGNALAEAAAVSNASDAAKRFASVVVRSVTPLDSKGRLVDYITGADSISEILVIYADGTSARYVLTGLIPVSQLLDSADATNETTFGNGVGATNGTTSAERNTTSGINAASGSDASTALAFAVEGLPTSIAFIPAHAGISAEQAQKAALTPETLAILQKLQQDVQGKQYQQTKIATKDAAGNVTEDGEFLHSQEYKDFFGVQDDLEIQEMYLDAPFKRAMLTVISDITALIANSEIADLTNPTIQRYLSALVTQNRLALTVGLTYLHALYDFTYAPSAGATKEFSLNMKDLLTKHIEFYGRATTNGLAQVIEIGQIDGHHHWNNRIERIPVDLNIGANVRSGKDGFYGAAHNLAVYEAKFASKTGLSNVATFLQGTHDLLMPYEDTNDWYVRTSKARIVQVKSKAEPTADVRFFQRMSGQAINVRNGSNITGNDVIYRGMLLPLLCVTQNDVYIGVTMTAMHFGLAELKMGADVYIYKHYYEDPERYAAQYQKLQTDFDNILVHASKIWGDHYDAWYNILDDTRKTQFLARSLYIWDSYNLPRIGWVDYYTEEIPAAIEFIGPLAWHEPSRGFGAVSWGPNIAFIVDCILDDWGLSSWTHELTHSYDSNYYFAGQGRRQGKGGDTFATGFFQSPTNSNGSEFAFNFAYDYTRQFNNHQTPYIPTPEVVTGVDYIEHYQAGLMNMIYLLDYAQAIATLKLPADLIKNLYVTTNPNGGGAGNERFTGLIDLELAQKLKDFDDLVDNDISGSGWANAHWGGNTYARVNFLNPTYAGYATKDDVAGSTDSTLFIRRAHELMGTFGYYGGMVAYGSGKYNGHGDEYIMKQISNGKYQNFYEFLKDAYKNRRDIAWTLRDFNIEWSDAPDKRINSYEDISYLMDLYLKRYQDALAAIPEYQAKLDEAKKATDEAKAAYDATGWEEANAEFKASGQPNNNTSELFVKQDTIWKNGGQRTQNAWKAAQRAQNQAQNAFNNANNAPGQALNMINSLKKTLINWYNTETNNYQNSIFDGSWKQDFTAQIGAGTAEAQAADGSVRTKFTSVSGRTYAAGTKIALVTRDAENQDNLTVIGTVDTDGFITVPNWALPTTVGTLNFIALEADKAFTTASGLQVPAFALEMPAQKVTQQPSRSALLTYDANGGVGTAVAEAHNANEELTLAGQGTFTRKGYTLVGWSAGPNTTSYATGATFVMPGQATTLYAVWQAKTYTIIYNVNQGKPELPNKQVTWDESNLLPLPVASSGSAGSAGQGTSGSASGSTSGSGSGSGALTAPTRRGYNLVGWRNNGSGTVDMVSAENTFAQLAGGDDATTTITLTAIWSYGDVPDAQNPGENPNPNFAIITYKTEGAGAGAATLSHTAEALHILLGNLNVSSAGRPVGSTATAQAGSGYKFSHWKWQAADGSWQTLANATLVPAKSTDTGEYYTREYIAVFVPVEYQVSFNANSSEATGTMPNQTLTYDKSEALSKNTYTRPGYTFAGWAVTPDGERMYADAQTVSNLAQNQGAVLTLYALWNLAQNTVTFSAGGEESSAGSSAGSGSETAHGSVTGSGATQIVTTGDHPSMAEVTVVADDGYALAGWHYTMTAADGSTITGTTQNPELITITGDASFTAVWAALMSLSYKPGEHGAFNEEANQTFFTNLQPNAQAPAYAGAKDASGNPLGQAGWIFAGWRSADGQTYAPGAALPNIVSGASYVYTALWTAKTYTVHYDLQGGTASGASGSGSATQTTRSYPDKTDVGWNDANLLPAGNPTKTGYTFLGWYLKPDTSHSMNGAADGSAVPTDTAALGLGTRIEVGMSFATLAEALAALNGAGAGVSTGAGSAGSGTPSGTGTTSGAGAGAGAGSVIDLADSLTALTLYALWTWGQVPDAATATPDTNPNFAVITYGADGKGTISFVRPDQSGAEQDESGSGTTPGTGTNPGSGTTPGTGTNPGTNPGAGSGTTANTSHTLSPNKQVLHIVEGNINLTAGSGAESPNPGAESPNPGAESPYIGTPVTFTATPAAGYKLLYWKWTDANGVERTSTALTLTVTKDADGLFHSRTYTAVFAPLSYTVRFEPNGTHVTGTMPAQQFTYESTGALSANTFTRPGYTFAGWAVSAEAAAAGTVSYKADITLAELLAQVAEAFATQTSAAEAFVTQISVTQATNQIFPAAANTILPDGTVITLFAVWTPNQNTVTFSAGDASQTGSSRGSAYGTVTGAGTTQTVVTGGHVSIQDITVTPAEHVTFAGWRYTMTGADGATISAATNAPDQITITGPATFTAVWVILQSVTYLPGQHGTWQPSAPGTEFFDLVPGTRVAQGAPFGGTDAATRAALVDAQGNPRGQAGYTFAGWQLSDGTIYRVGQALPDITDNSSFIYTALWTPKPYTLVFDVQGGSTTPARQNMEWNTANLLPAVAPTRVGYAFMGWYTQAPDAQGNHQGTQVTAETTFAELAALNGLNGQNDTTNTVTLYAFWDAGVAPDPLHPGDHPNPNYAIFTYTSEIAPDAGSGASGQPGSGTTPGTADPSITPGSLTNTAEVVHITDSAGRIVGARAMAAKGYKFLRWVWTDDQGIEHSADTEIITPQKENGVYHTTAFRALFRPFAYTVHFASDASHVAGTMDDQTLTYNTNQTLTANKLVRPGYIFEGWSTRPSSQTDPSNPGSPSGAAAVEFNNGQSLTELTDAEGNLLADGSRLTLYAVWTAASNRVVFTIDPSSQKGTLSGETSGQVVTGKTLAEGIDMSNITVTPQANAKLIGWRYTMTDADGKDVTATTETPENITITGPATFTALFASLLSVTYMPGDHAAWNANDPGTVFENLSAGARVADVAPFGGKDATTRAALVDTQGNPKGALGWKFVGWIDQDGHLYLPTDTLPDVAEGVAYVYTAQWEADIIQVIFNTLGGSDVAVQNITRGATIAQPAEPIRSGYTFGGWFTDAALTQAFDFTAPLSAEVPNPLTLFAKWVAAVVPDPGTDPDPVGPDPTDPGKDPDPVDPDPTDPGTNPTDPGTDPANPNQPATEPMLMYNANASDAYPITGTLPAAQTGAAQTTVAVATPEFYRPGWQFLEWNTRADGMGASYLPGANFILSAGTSILYAIWEFVGGADGANPRADAGQASLTEDPADKSAAGSYRGGAGAYAQASYAQDSAAFSALDRAEDQLPQTGDSLAFGATVRALDAILTGYAAALAGVALVSCIMLIVSAARRHRRSVQK